MEQTMKKANFLARFIIGLFLVAVIAGCAGSRHQESTGDYIDDSAITAKVKAEIIDDPILKVFQISVETFKGVVQLSGFVDSAKVAARAAEVAKSVRGVHAVKNNLIVK